MHRQYRDGAPAVQLDSKVPPAPYAFATAPRAINIPNAPQEHHVPPPLPPPREPLTAHSTLDSQSQYSMRSYFEGPRAHNSSLSSVASSNYGSMDGSYHDRMHKRRDSFGHVTDEGYSSLSSTRLPSLSKDFGLLHANFHPTSADDHASKLKDKLGHHIPTKAVLSRAISRSWTELPPMRSQTNAASLPSLQQFSMPIPYRPMPMDSPPTESSKACGGSPRIAAMNFQFNGRRHGDSSDYDRSPPHRHTPYGHDSPVDESEMQHLNLLDRDRIGMKRRASSPLDVDNPLPPAPSQVELMRRRELHWGSPTTRLGTILHSPMAPAGGPFPVAGSLPSYDRTSPGGYSSGTLSPMGDSMTASPFGHGSGNSPLNVSPRGSISRSGPTQRNGSVASPRRVSELKGDCNKITNFHMCECCSKKPKKFGTLEELQAHEAEKQYECQYCGNRFKNKNEAERHQNSLHVRRHSWSCKTLEDYTKAFHENQASGGKLDTCGYCGKDFERRGPLKMDGMTREASDQDWEERVRHLQTAHKFRECNSSKKFFRADHFRQHLKHSHSGTSGKWTNQLENACMHDESPPQKI
ncbi:hypothetical protein TD95_001343 [Thielaviopsis punctulata]|uniref:C2H2-type domain-containing protein n=1 Tax=Thielaviopsis punctulata TaxID=72032 RepID=A0A0F4ZIJ8_9PEZI|nr:hypothetical protein TD95_001343 [Thielaviopsis punctulata]